jgi:hypothetical protein
MDFNQLLRNELMKIKGNKIVYRKKVAEKCTKFSTFSQPHKKSNNLEEIIIKSF